MPMRFEASPGLQQVPNNNSNNGKKSNHSMTSDKPMDSAVPSMAAKDVASNSNGNGMMTSNNNTRDIDYYGSSKLETTRLIIQALHEMGYNESASVLESESHCSIESSEVSAFRSSILSGKWRESEQLLESLELKAGTNKTSLLFLIRQQKFLELLEKRDTVSALTVLREELSVLNYDLKQLHVLSSLMMCVPEDDFKQQAKWSGAEGGSRTELLQELQEHISPSVMIPDHRLATLFDQARQYQIMKCAYHNFDGPTSLYTDHVCDRSELPTVTTHILSDHTSEVWFVLFSNDGSKLASASEDGSIIIWDVATMKSILVLGDLDDPVSLGEHEKPVISGRYKKSVTSLAWSPDDSMLLTCSFNSSVKIWDLQNGVCVFTTNILSQPITSCAWLPNGKQFLTGTLVYDKSMTLWNLDGSIEYEWSGMRVYDLALTPDGKKVVAIVNKVCLHIYDLQERKKIAVIHSQSNMACVTVSRDSRYAIVNIPTQEIHIWDIEKVQLVHKCVGQLQTKYIIRSCFGGVNDNFIISGSEDANIYIWRKSDGMLIEVLSGHTKFVNCVSWNPTNKHMFASASDDHTIRIWESGSSTVE
ncbi:WD40-repeat-containing domain protein [Dipodascopsis uninucleata]